MRIWSLQEGRLGAVLLDLVLPPVCLGCGGSIAAGDLARGVCRRCRSRLTAPTPPVCARCGAPLRQIGVEAAPDCRECRGWPAAVRSARAACLLRDPADRLVHGLKYHGWRTLAGPMAERMAAVRFPEDVEREARLVTAVPTTRKRRRQRGYNQAEELAREYAARVGRRLVALLERTGSAGTQTSLQPVARAANVAGAFRLTQDARAVARGQHVLLVDDVLTTGATTAECARTLVDGGARCVSVLTFARAID